MSNPIWHAFNDLVTPKSILTMQNRPSENKHYKTFSCTLGNYRLKIDVPEGFGSMHGDQYGEEYFNKIVNFQMEETSKWLVFEKTINICIFSWYYKLKYLLGSDYGNSGNVLINASLVQTSGSLKSLSELKSFINNQYEETVKIRLAEIEADSSIDEDDEFEKEAHEDYLKSIKAEKPHRLIETSLNGTPCVYYEMNNTGNNERYYGVPLESNYFLLINVQARGGICNLKDPDKMNTVIEEDINSLVNKIQIQRS